MNGYCYFSEGLNPAVTCNKNEGNRVAIPVLTPERTDKRQNGEAHTLNCSDQRKVFGANQTRTMAGYMLGMNATRNGGVLTDTALALNARDHKGLGTSKQLMTIAAVCLQSTKESNLTNEMSQTALSQEKTEDSLNENRKER